MCVYVCVHVQPALDSTFNPHSVASLRMQPLRNVTDLDHCVDVCQKPINVLLLQQLHVSKEKIPLEINNPSVRVQVEMHFFFLNNELMCIFKWILLEEAFFWFPTHMINEIK